MQNSLHTLDLVERQFDEVALLLIAGDAVSLEVASVTLKDLALELSRLVPKNARAKGPGKALCLRLRTLAFRGQVLRENLARRAAFVEHAVRVLVPTAPKSTYSGGSTVYGRAIQQSGMFKVLAA